MSQRIIFAAAIAAAAVPALADEVWTTGFGEVVYEADIGDTAVLRVEDPTNPGRLYFPGLAGNFEDRGTHWGYWIAEGDGPCDATLTGADGSSGNAWGHAVLTFDQPAFPTAWTAMLGQCFEDFETAVRAEPK